MRPPHAPTRVPVPTVSGLSTHPPQRTALSATLRAGARGFTLVEVALCIGIVAVAFVGILSLLPVGLGMFRQAIDTSVGSHIVQRLVGEAQQTDYPTLIATTTHQRYFDEQGTEVESTANYLYIAEISVTSPTSLPDAGTPPSANLAKVTIKLANDPARQASPFAPDSKVPYETHTALIARNQ